MPEFLTQEEYLAKYGKPEKKELLTEEQYLAKYGKPTLKKSLRDVTNLAQTILEKSRLAVKPVTQHPVPEILTGGLLLPYLHPKETAEWLPFAPKYEEMMALPRKKIFGVETFVPSAQKYLPDWLVGGLMPTDLGAEILPKLIGKAGEPIKKLRAEELGFRKKFIGGILDIYTRPDVLALELFPKIAKWVTTRPMTDLEHNLLQKVIEPVRHKLRLKGIITEDLFDGGTALKFNGITRDGKSFTQQLFFNDNLCRILKGQKIRVPRGWKMDMPLVAEAGQATEAGVGTLETIGPKAVQIMPIKAKGMKPPLRQAPVILARWKEISPVLTEIPQEDIMHIPPRRDLSKMFEVIEEEGLPPYIEGMQFPVTPLGHPAGPPKMQLPGKITQEETEITSIISRSKLQELKKLSQQRPPKRPRGQPHAPITRIVNLEAIEIPEIHALRYMRGGSMPGPGLVPGEWRDYVTWLRSQGRRANYLYPYPRKKAVSPPQEKPLEVPPTGEVKAEGAPPTTSLEARRKEIIEQIDQMHQKAFTQVGDYGAVMADDINTHDLLEIELLDIEKKLKVTTARNAITGKPMIVQAVRVGAEKGRFFSDIPVREFALEKTLTWKTLEFKKPVVFKNQWHAIQKLFGKATRTRLEREYAKLKEKLKLGHPFLSLKDLIVQPEIFQFWNKIDKKIINSALKKRYDGIVYYHDKGVLSGEYIDLSKRESEPTPPTPTQLAEKIIAGKREITIPEEKAPEKIIEEKVPPVGLSLKKVRQVPDDITIVEEPPDLTGLKGFLKSWWYPVRHIARTVGGGNFSASAQIARWGRDAMLHLTALQRQASNKIHGLFNGLKKDQKKLTVERLDRVFTQEEYDALPKPEKESYIKTREYLVNMKKISAMIKNVDVGKWSIPDDAYWPHIFIDKYQILDGKKIVAFGRSEEEAIDKAIYYKKEHPDSSVWVQPKVISLNYTGTLISRKGYFRLKSNIDKFIKAVEEATTFDAEEIELLSKGIVAIKPRPKFVRSFERRVANLGGYITDDPELALKIYSHAIFRKLVLDPFRHKATEVLSQLEPGLRDYFDEFIDDVGGKYDPINKNFQISKFTSYLTRAQSFLKLGYRPSSALVNSLQPFHTTFNEIGLYMFKGAVFSKTPLGAMAITHSEVAHTPAKYYALETTNISDPKWYAPMWMFSKTETTNRTKLTLAGGYLFAQDIFKMDRTKAVKKGFDYLLEYLDHAKQFRDEWIAKNPNLLAELEKVGITGESAVNRYIASVEYAKDGVADTQYLYDVSDLAKIFRTRGGRAIFQFKNYTLNTLIQSAYWLNLAITNPNPHNIARATRLIASNILLGGIKLPLFLMRQAGEIIHPLRGWYKKIMLAILGAILMHKKKGRETTAKVLNTIYRGVFSILGVDLSERIAPDVYAPRNPLDWFGPTLGDLRDIWTGIQEGKPILEVVLRPWLLGRRLYEVATNKDVEEMKSEKTVTYATPYERFLYAIGLLPQRLADVRDIQHLMFIEDAEYKRLRSIYIDKLTVAIKKHAPEEVINSIVEDAAEKGVPFQKRDRYYIMMNLSPALYRQFKRMPRMRRGPYIRFVEEELEGMERFRQYSEGQRGE